MSHNDLTEVAGLRVGHETRRGDGLLTGTTVVVAPDGGAVGGVDVRGGGPGTRETDLLDPRNLVDRAHAVVLTGGSAYGLAAADGVMRALRDDGVGLPVGASVGEVLSLVGLVEGMIARGFSVLEVLDAVDRVAGVTLQRTIAPRRLGDAGKLVSDNARILATLDWTPAYADLDTIVAHALEWERGLAAKSNA